MFALMLRAFVIIALSLFVTGSASAQFRSGAENRLVESYTFFTLAQQDQSTGIPLEADDAPVAKRKSPVLAAILSLAVPGLGEYYVGDQIWRGLIFTAIEGGLWYGNILYTGRGDDSTRAFQDFAHTNWSPERYATHLDSLLVIRGVTAFFTDYSDFRQINRAEDTLNSLGLPYFTHRLPPKGHQQYYELISKYNQFARGWTDATGDMLSSSPMSLRHAIMRDNMNDQYGIAQTFVYGIIINHVLSAVDAVLLARDHNSPIRVESETRLRRLPDATQEIRTDARIQVRF